MIYLVHIAYDFAPAEPLFRGTVEAKRPGRAVREAMRVCQVGQYVPVPGDPRTREMRTYSLCNATTGEPTLLFAKTWRVRCTSS